jgi:hypothetical protein
MDYRCIGKLFHVSRNSTPNALRHRWIFILLATLFSCKHKIGPTSLIVGSWITSSIYDSVKSIHTFDRKGNYFIDDSSFGRRTRRFTIHYRFSVDGKYLIPILGGGEPEMEITKLTNNELELTIGSYTRKYERYQ